MIALTVHSQDLMKALYAVDPYCVHHGEISAGIARAANEDPFFPDRYDGCYRTAAVLIALGWLASRFQPNLIGLNGKAFGLYQIRPPSHDAQGKPITSNMLTNPTDSSFIAIDLVRQGMVKDQGREWEERLFSFCEEQQEPSPMHRSLEVMLLSDDIMKKHFPQEMRLLPPPAPAIPAWRLTP